MMSPEQMEAEAAVDQRKRFKRVHEALRAEIRDLAAKQERARIEKIQKSPYRAMDITIRLRLLIVIRRGAKALVSTKRTCRCCGTVLEVAPYEVHALPPGDHGLAYYANHEWQKLVERLGAYEFLR